MDRQPRLVAPRVLACLTDRGTKRRGALASDPRGAFGIPVITTVGSELWVASASGEGMGSVCPSCSPVAAKTLSNHHHRRHRQ